MENNHAKTVIAVITYIRGPWNPCWFLLPEIHSHEMNLPGFVLVTRPGKRLRFATEAMAIEIVDLPSYKKWWFSMAF